MSETVTIARRFCGPPHSGNGGYSCGAAARFIDGPAQVKLRAPPPLDAPLRVVRGEAVIELRHGETLIAEARAARPLIEPPPAPSFAEAEAAALLYRGHRTHIFPTCFVCGPDRAAGDGLCIFCGAAEEMVAAPWIPAPDLASADGRVADEFLWAALDCPSYWALPRAGAIAAVLGALTAEVHRRPAPGERLVVGAWARGAEGRKHFSASAIYDASGETLARAEAVWIELKQEAASA